MSDKLYCQINCHTLKCYFPCILIMVLPINNLIKLSGQ